MKDPKELKKNRGEIVEDLIDEHGYLFCQMCGKSNAFQFHCHHIMSRGKFPKHPLLHDKKNLIIVCNVCHDRCHFEPEYNERTIKQRRLDEYFKS